MCARVCHMSLSWARSDQSMSTILFLKDQFECVPPFYAWVFQVVFPFVFHEQNLCTFHFPRMLCISSFVWFLGKYFVKNRYYEPAHNIVFFIPVLPFPFRPRYHSQHPNLKYPQLMFLLLVRDQVSHPYRTTWKVIVLCILIFTFLGSKLDSRWFWAKCQKAIPKCILGQMSEGNPQVHSAAVDFFSECNFDVSGLFTNIWTLPHFQRVYYMYCDFVLHAVHETAIYFPLSQHLLLDQSPYNALMKLMVCMLWPHKLTSSSSIMTCVYRWISTICYLFWLS